MSKSNLKLSRRNLLKTAAAGGTALVLGFDIAPVLKGKPVKETVSPFRSWIRIDQAGAVTLFSGRSEMGQGISTALPMILAEELGCNWNDVTIEQAPLDPSLYGESGTGGSGSVAGSWLPMRQAGAAARTLLINAAATRWNVTPGTCVARNGAVYHGADSVKFGDLVEAASKLAIPDYATVQLKKPEDFQLIGKPLERRDIPSKVDGSAVYGLDVRVPGMAYAMVERCPVFGGKVKHLDATETKAMPGIHDVFEIPAVPEGVHSWGGVAVVADSTWIAMQGRKKLKIEWDLGPHAGESSETLRRQFRTLVDSQMKVVLNRGDADSALSGAQADKRVEADYELPFQAHATMEPMNCTVHITGDRAEAWVPAQGPEWVRQVIGQVSGLKPERITVHTTQMGGGFGRRYQADFAIEAAQVAKRIGKPVQLVWSREDDMTHDFYRPASYHRLSGAVDAQGNIAAWRHKSTSTSIAEWWSPKDTPESSELGCTMQMPYIAESYKLEYLPAASGVPRAWWRSVEASSIAFVMESFMDELAHAAKSDPYEFRMAKLEGDRSVRSPNDKDGKPLETARMRAVLKLAATKGDWGKPLAAGYGRGIACHFSFNSYAANVVEVSFLNKTLKVERVISAIDIGTPVHPSGITAQVESAIIYGLTAALKSQITIENGHTVQANFNRFATLSMKETPHIEVYITPSALPPTGIGEPGLPPLAPALMNAVFAATGKRIRRLPFQAKELA
jgi:isoquinoline 1-oxidoreductase subunit beta